MKKLAIIISLSFSFLGNAQSNYLKIHQNAVFADSHNDILTACIEKKLSMDDNLKGKTHSDLNRFKQAGVDVQIFSVWCDGTKLNPFAWANREMDTLDAVVARNPNKIVVVKNHKELARAVQKHQLAAMFGVEGGHMMANDLNNLNKFYERGVRYMTLTWNNSTSWATSAFDETTKKDSLSHAHKGLTDFGKEVVKRMNSLGILVDLSHTGEQTFWDAIQTSTKPVIVSHSNAYALCPIFRNLKDEQIIAVGKNGGVIDINFYSGFVDSSFIKKESLFTKKHTSEIDSLIKLGVQKDYAVTMLTEKYRSEVISARPSLGLLIDHLDYIVRLAGIDHVGIGSDFDGISSAPQELDDVTNYPVITKALLDRGYSKKDINKILGGNLLRVLKANE
jgi:membrane dipeptidase